MTTYSKSFTVAVGSTAVTMPADFNPNSNRIQCWAAGAAGNNGLNRGGPAGGGGAYSESSNIPFEPGQTYNCNVPAGAPTTATGGVAQAGGDCWIGGSGGLVNSTVGAQGGQTVSASSSSSAKGGLATNGVGQIKYSGGSGGTGSTAFNGGGGGGAAGPDGVGANGQNATSSDAGSGGTGDAGKGGAGGTLDLSAGASNILGGGGGGGNAGSNGFAGGSPGGGGGGDDGGVSTGGAGGDAQMVISYNPFIKRPTRRLIVTATM